MSLASVTAISSTLADLHFPPPLSPSPPPPPPLSRSCRRCPASAPSCIGSRTHRRRRRRPRRGHCTVLVGLAAGVPCHCRPPHSRGILPSHRAHSAQRLVAPSVPVQPHRRGLRRAAVAWRARTRLAVQDCSRLAPALRRRLTRWWYLTRSALRPRTAPLTRWWSCCSLGCKPRRQSGRATPPPRPPLHMVHEQRCQLALRRRLAT